MVVIVDYSGRSIPYDLELVKGISENGYKNFQLWVPNEDVASGCDNILSIGFESKSRFLQIINFFIVYIRLFFLALIKNVDVIHFQWLPLFERGFYIEIYFLMILKKIGAKLVFTAHNIKPNMENGFSLDSYEYSLFDAIIVHNEIVRARLLNIYEVPEKVHVVSHGLLAPNLHCSCSWSSSKSKKQILFFGVIRFNKGVNMLINAWKSVKNKMDYRLVIAGRDIEDVYSKEVLNNTCDDTLSIINEFLSEEELHHLISESSFVVLPYRSISTSGVLLKAIWYGKPVIVSNLEVLMLDVVDGFNGYIFENGNVMSLVSVLEKAINLTGLEIDNLKCNQQFVSRNRPSWKEIGYKTIGFY